MLSLEAIQRRFYALDEAALKRLITGLLDEELSVAEGGILDRFEEEAAAFLGGRHAVAVCNGTAAIHLALFALDLKPGDEVLLSTYGYYASALPVCMLGGVPVFCDVREDTMALDVEDAADQITPRTRAILVHQPWGCPADVDALRALAARYGLALISDSSHAQGTLWDGLPLGRYYDFVCASLGKGKLISGGELGVVVTNEPRFRDRMLLYGHVNRVPRALATPEYRHLENAVGVKYRPHAFALALAREQLQTYADRSQRLVRNIQRLEAGLASIEGFAPVIVPEKARRVYWRVPVRVDTRRLGGVEPVATQLAHAGCPVDLRNRRLIHEHNVLTDYYGVATLRRFPAAEQVLAETLLLEAFPFYDEELIEPALAGFLAVSRSGRFDMSTQ